MRKNIPSIEVFGPRFARFFQKAQRTKGYHQVLSIGLGIVFILTLGWLQLHSIKGLNFEFFYLFGCVMVGWSAGTAAALVCAVFSALLLYWAELPEGNGISIGWLFFCNSLVRLGVFAVSGWVAAGLGRQARDLEQTVRQRTVRLQNEVEDHKETSELLLEATQLSRQLTDNIADVFSVADPLEQEVEYISPGFERVWGQTCSALYARPSVWLEGIHHEDRDRVMNGMF